MLVRSRHTSRIYRGTLSAFPSRLRFSITSDWHVVVWPIGTALASRRVRHFSGLFFFFSLGIIPRLQPHLPLGFVGGGYEQSGWCFVEACAVSCEHLTQNETLVTCMCVSRVPDAPTALVTNRGFASGVVFLCVFFATLRLPFHRSSRMTDCRLDLKKLAIDDRGTIHFDGSFEHGEAVQEWPHAASRARRRCEEAGGRNGFHQRFRRGQGGGTLQAFL